MFKLKDRYDRDMCLAMTHEEVVAWLAAKEIRSYRDLPQIWYQIQTKERDEARPRSGVLRTREFLMKDSYTLDPDVAALEVSYNAHKDAYCRIFDRCGLQYVVVQSDPGMMGGSGSHEFMAPSAAGEDDVALCDACGYAANVELARAVPSTPAAPDWERGEVATPDVRTIAEVSAFLGIDPALTVKSLVFIADDAALLALVRGDHALHERKLARALKREARPARPEEVAAHLGVAPGSVGPVGARGVTRILADESLRGGRYVVGANRDGYHLTAVAPGTDFECEFADLQVALRRGGLSPVRQAPAHRARHRDRQYLQARDEVLRRLLARCTWTSKASSSRSSWDRMGSAPPGSPPGRSSSATTRMASSGPGPSRRSRCTWSRSGPRTARRRAPAEEIYGELRSAGFDVLLDDRDERAGVKFKDADLLGVPIRVTVGNLLAKEGLVEIRNRRDRTDQRIARGQLLEALRDLARSLSGGT